LLVLLISMSSAWAADNGRPASDQDLLAIFRTIERRSNESRDRAIERFFDFGIARSIDRQIDRRIHAEMIPPSPQAGDGQFCRRVYIDIIGRVPTLDETMAFLDSRDPEKRAKLIDELLASPEYGQHWATIWNNLSVNRSDASQLAVNFHRARFQNWL